MKNDNEKDLNNAFLTEEQMKLIHTKNNEEKESKNSLINILQNLEKDLILANNCEKEFDLEKNNFDEAFEKTEVFGEPECFICTTKKINYSSIKLFYCRHCKKLFCKNCLKIHYESGFVNIEDSYLKYKNENSEINELANKKIIEEMGCFKAILFIVFYPCFNFFYLISIFSMKPIKSSLEIVILNCIKEIFTDKIEDPDSLFNFYEIFFQNTKILTFNFDLIMIMNFLGNRMLISWGFTITSFIFIVINYVFFILLYNFNFIEYNENNKYSILKFLYLIGLYILIFIGLGSSSLLSNTIMAELGKKSENKNEKENDSNDNYIEQQNEIIDSNNDKSLEATNETISFSERQKIKEHLKKNQSYQGFLIVTIFTLFSFTVNYFNNLGIIKEKYEKDNKIKNETYAKYNISMEDINNNTNITKSINHTINNEIYEKTKNYFLNTYLNYYAVVVYAILLYLMFKYCLLEKDTEPTKKNNKITLSNDDFDDQDILIINDENNNLNIFNKNNIKEDQNKNSKYILSKICGFFYFSEQTDLKGEIPCCKKLGNYMADFFCLNCITFIDCCNITFCNIINIILCNGKKTCKCNYDCCGYEKNNFNKTTEYFCFCYKQKRKNKWFHDYMTSTVQKEIFPYILEYFLLGFTVIGLEKKSLEYDFYSKILLGLNAGNWEYIIKISFILLITILIFFNLSFKFGEEKLKKIGLKDDNSDYYFTYSILGGIHIILLVNSIISLLFSILYFWGIQYFDVFIFIPILMYKYFYLILNFYCTSISQIQNAVNDVIFSHSFLITIYIVVCNFIFSLIQQYFENFLILFIIQTVTSSIIIVLYIYYLIFSDSKFKYMFCENCVNKKCCNCKDFCSEGYQYCDCCCCDKNSFC